MDDSILRCITNLANVCLRYLDPRGSFSSAWLRLLLNLDTVAYCENENVITVQVEFGYGVPFLDKI
jgi:hypothetical protein